MSNILEIVVYFFVLLGIDLLFLKTINNLFSKQIMRVQKEPMRVNIYGAIASYLFLFLALYYFIIRQNGSILNAMVLGFVLYGVYETTSYALLKNWEVKTVVIDTLWGSVLFGITVYISRLIINLL